MMTNVAHMDAFSLVKKQGQAFCDGSVRIQLLHPDETVDTDTGFFENAKAVPAGILFATLVKDPNARTISHLALGTGESSFDILDPPEVVTNTKLVAELIRKPVAFSNFVDGTGSPSLDKTNTVDLTFRFEQDEANATLKEMGLFGGKDAENPNQGLLTNYKAFAEFTKPNNRIMVVTWRLRFNFSSL